MMTKLPFADDDGSEGFEARGPYAIRMLFDEDGSRPDDKIQSPRFPQTAPIDEAVPRQCPP
jgi:hypothetical protein